MAMMLSFFRRIKSGEGRMIVHVAIKRSGKNVQVQQSRLDYEL